jgi:ribonuclease BN (tRNA processing enzyme)
VALPGGGVATAFLTSHEEHHFDADCLGWSFQDAGGRRLVYSGDSGPSPVLEEAARGCDLLLIECSTPDHLAVATHLSPAGVAVIARNSRPGRVVLTHMYPLVAAERPDRAVADATGLPCDAAQDGDVFTIPDPREHPS